MATVQIQQIAPHAARITLSPEPQFYRSYLHIGGARFDHEGQAVTCGLSFEDGARTTVHTVAKLAPCRRHSCPEYVLDDGKLAMVLTYLWTRRAYGAAGRYEFDATGDLRAQLHAAQEHIKKFIIPRELQFLDEACRAYVNASDPVSKAHASSLVRHYDSELQTLKRGAGVVARCLILYWRVGYNSVDVAREVGLSPVHVRQLTHRASWAWKQMQKPQKPRPAKRPLSPAQLAQQERRRKINSARRRIKAAEARLRAAEADHAQAIREGDAVLQAKLQATIDQIWEKITPELLKQKGGPKFEPVCSLVSSAHLQRRADKDTPQRPYDVHSIDNRP